jgi:hypothetical protein
MNDDANTHASVMLRRPLAMPPLLLLEDAAGAAADEGALQTEVLEDEAAAAAADDHVVDCKCQVLPRFIFVPLYLTLEGCAHA